MHILEIRFVIGLENRLFAGMCVCAICSPEILQAEAGKGLKKSTKREWKQNINLITDKNTDQEW